MIEDLLELLPEACLVLTAEGEILQANSAAGKLLGRGASALRGTHIGDLVESEAGNVLEFLRMCSGTRGLLPTRVVWRGGNGGVIETRCDAGLLSPASEGESRPAMVFLRCRSQDEAVGRFQALNEKIDALSREIAERRKMETAMRHSEERYRTLVAATASVVWSADAFGQFVKSQPSWEAFTGQTAAEYPGSGWLNALHPDDRERIRALWEQSAASGGTFDTEARFRQSGEDSYRRCVMRAAPVRDRDGAIQEWMGTITDVEEQKRFEDQLRQAQRLESLGVLAGGVAHDFNNLLVGILGNASMALESISSNSPARLMLKDVVAASESAANLTRQLLAYAGKGRFLIEPLDISDLIRQIHSLIQTSIPKTVQVRLELAEKLPCVEGDASQLQQLIMNLVINGAEAIGDQPGTVLVTTGLQDIDEQYIQSIAMLEQIEPGRYVTLEVHDTGIGMTEETISRIFDPFFTTKFMGRGLGLAAALGIVRGHRGGIKVYSTLGRGSTFKVLFPAAAQEKTVRPEKPGAERKSAGLEGVLVIDDEPIVRRTAKAMLERYGYAVYLAENGREGVDLFRALGRNVHAVLLDMTMPVMSGEETFRELKEISPDVPVILSSGYNEVEAIRRFTGKGLAGFVQKPYGASALVEKVRTVMEEWRARAASQ